MLAEVVGLWGALAILFGWWVVTAFCLHLAAETDIHFKGLVLARALRYFERLHSFFPEVGESGPYCFSFLVFPHDAHNQGQLPITRTTFGNCSYVCLSVCSARWVSISMMSSWGILKGEATC